MKIISILCDRCEGPNAATIQVWLDRSHNGIEVVNNYGFVDLCVSCAAQELTRLMNGEASGQTYGNEWLMRIKKKK